MEELFELKKRFESKRDTFSQDVVFNEWHRIYRNTNENLAFYMKDLKEKKVLTVSASGDYKINAINLDASRVDTFDINRYSPLFQELKMKAIKYLSTSEALDFLYEIDPKLYKKFAMTLNITTRDVFDYLFNNYSVDYIYHQLFDYGRVIKSNNTYFNHESIAKIKSRIDDVESTHYQCNVYELPYMVNTLYDVIYLSNISQYEDGKKYLSLLRNLRNNLTEGGKIFFGYSYSTNTDDIDENLFRINPSYKLVDKDEFDDVYSSMGIDTIPGASGSIGDVDAVIHLKK